MKKVVSLIAVASLFVTVQSVHAQCGQSSTAVPSLTETIVVHEFSVGDETSELLARLEKLVEPMAVKVASCNSELQAAEEAVQHRQGELAAAEACVQFTFRKLQLLKRTLCQPGCMVQLGNCEYPRESVAKVMEAELSKYRVQLADVSVRKQSLEQALAFAEEVAAKAERWRQAEAQLLSEFEALSRGHEEQFGNVAPTKEDLSDSARITGQLEMMLDSSTNRAEGESSSESELSRAELSGVVEEVDNLLGSSSDR
jgi:hypothetical protein